MNRPADTQKINDHLRLRLQDRGLMLDSLMDNLDGLVYCCLPDEHWTMVFVSSGCKQLTGYSPQDLLFNRVTSYENITHPDDRESVRDKIGDAIREHERFSLEYRILRADGSLCWVWERGVAIYDDQDVVVAIEGFIQDISPRKYQEQALSDAEIRYRSIFENAVEGIFQTSLSGQYLDANPALARIYGHESVMDMMSDLVNIQTQLYVDPGRRDEFRTLMDLHGKVQNFESQVHRKDGEVIWISENARTVKNEAGELLYYEGTVEDITERRTFEAQIQHQATHDSLTGLPNRYLLEDRLQQSINFAERYHTKLAVAFVDLDQFKHINDSLGHDAGDTLLLTVSERLSALVRDSDTVVRLGGDEFVILLTSIQKNDYVTQTMKRVLDAISQPVILNSLEFRISCSIGISIYPEDGTQANILLKNADTAMYKAKQSGRNNFQYFTHKLNAILQERMDIERKLRNATKREELLLYYQPKVDIADNKVNGAEALIRWVPEAGTMISPARFIPIAEETGLIEEIGDWVLNSACLQSHVFLKKFGRPILVSINISPRQFQRKGLAQHIADIITRTGADPQYIELEITESTLADDISTFITTLHELKAIGVKLAIDDFGTGYSSMTYLKDFPIDRLKIDQGFVYNLEQTPANSAILKAIVTLGHNLGLKVIAEGVETEFQRDFLRDIGCDELQGYLYSKPIEVNDFMNLVMKTAD
jgi:diguanylate cyclase (GGDEF)-like protein/PAS domain S-box-containing protein